MKPVTRTSSPLVTPPSRPPALLVGRTGAAASGPGRISSCTREPGPDRHFGSDADADRLDGVDAHDRLAEASVELAIPLHVRAEARRHAGRDDLERAAERVAGFARRVDRGHHPLLDVARRRSGAAHLREPPALRRRRPSGSSRSIDVANRRHMAGDADAEAAQQLARQAAGGDARRRLARAGALEHVADVVVAVLDGAGEVGVARAGAASRPPASTPLAPSGISRSTYIVCCQLTQSRLRISRAIGAPVVRAVADAGEDLRAVAFDGHPPSAAVAALPPPELLVERVDVELEARRHAVDGDDERLAVRFAGGEKSEHVGILPRHKSQAQSQVALRCDLAW